MWTKNFRHRKLQTFMLFIIIMLSAMSLCGSISILISLEQPYYQLAEEGNAATACISTVDRRKEPIEKLAAEFEELKEVDHVSMYMGHSISEDFSSGDQKIDVFANLTEYSDEIFKDIRYVDGESIRKKELKEDECCVPACICSEYDLKIGDQIEIDFPEKKAVYTIRTIYSEIYGASTAYTSNIFVKVLPKETMQEYFIRIYGKEGITGKQIEEAYREKHDGDMNCNMTSLEEYISNNLIAGTIMGAIFLAIGGILIIVSGLIINFMVRNTMINDAKSIAIYKTIGYSYFDIIKMYLIFYFVVTSAGILAGIAGASFFTKAVLDSMYKNIGAMANGDVLLPGICCYIFVVSFVLIIIYSIMRKTGKMKPVYTLNGLKNENTRKKKNYKGDSRMTFSAFGIAVRNVGRDKKGTIGVICTAIVTIFAVNFMIISFDVAKSIPENNDYWLGLDNSQVMISAASGVDAAEIGKLLEGRPEIDHMHLCNLKTENYTLDWEKGIDFTTVIAFIYDDFDKTSMKVLSGRNPETEDEIAIGYKVAQATHKEIGDYINIHIGNEEYSLLITGIYQSYQYMGKCVRATSKLYEVNNIPFAYDTLSICLKEDTDVDQFMKDIEDVVGSKGSINRRMDMFTSIMSMISDPQEKAIPPMTVLIVLIGAANIFCIVMLKNANNEKTNGIYKSIGYSTGHLVQANVWYIVMIAVCSTAVALPAVLIFYPCIMKICLMTFGLLEYEVTYNYLHILITNIGIFAAFIISTILSSRSLRRVNVRDLVQE